MNKEDIVKGVCDLLNERSNKKKVPKMKSVIHISDDDGNSHDFIIRKDSAEYKFTKADISRFLDCFTEYVYKNIQNGKDVNINGFGKFKLIKRAKRNTFHPITKEPVEIDAHYLVKFYPGKRMETASKLYNIYAKERDILDGGDKN